MQATPATQAVSVAQASFSALQFAAVQSLQLPPPESPVVSLPVPVSVPPPVSPPPVFVSVPPSLPVPPSVPVSEVLEQPAAARTHARERMETSFMVGLLRVVDEAPAKGAGPAGNDCRGNPVLWYQSEEESSNFP
jgi:hypothetical protein